MLRFSLWIILLLSVISFQTNFCATACHAGYSHGGGRDDDDDDEDDDIEGLIESGTEDNGTRRKRQVEEEFQTEDLEILRDYFRDCMTDKVGLIWDWRSVVDFSILDTIWYLYSSTVACSEERETDSIPCWQTCIEVFLRDNSTLVAPAKECVQQYADDFERRIPVYRSVNQKQYKAVAANFSVEYGKCIIVTDSNEESRLFSLPTFVGEPTGNGEKDISSILEFIRKDVKCRICDYGFLPGTDIKPSFADNLPDDGRDRFMLWSNGGRVEYAVTWPFTFEALTRRDSSLRFAATFCNQEFAPAFAKNPPPDLGWAEWVNWGVCNSQCRKVGTRRRIRVCLDETKKNCPGKSEEIEVCFNGNCAHWAEWGRWTPCHLTCGLSIQMSFRKCKNGVTGQDGCEGDFKRTRNCIVKSCPVPWSQWSSCSVTCGKGGVRTRSGGKSLLDIKKETIACYAPQCTGEWSQWSPATTCSVTCGYGGTRTRIRKCIGGELCEGNDREELNCKFVSCPPKRKSRNHWSEWSDWGDCIWRRRTRYCVGGKYCDGDDVDFKKCDKTQCPASLATVPPVTAKWSQWTSWTECLSTCGPGKRYRRRRCQSTLGMHKNCFGRREDISYCENDPCPSERIYSIVF